MKILKGSVLETLYDGPEDETATYAPRATQTKRFQVDEVTYICDEIGLHKIGVSVPRPCSIYSQTILISVQNASETEVAVSLHLYTPPHAANFGFNLYDETTGKQTHICQAGFYSERGKRLAVCGPGNL